MEIGCVTENLQHLTSPPARYIENYLLSLLTNFAFLAVRQMNLPVQLTLRCYTRQTELPRELKVG